MNLKANPELKGIKDALIKGMLDYRADGGAGYTKAHVEKCRCLLEEHLDAISSATSRDAVRNERRTFSRGNGELAQLVRKQNTWQNRNAIASRFDSGYHWRGFTDLEPLIGANFR